LVYFWFSVVCTFIYFQYPSGKNWQWMADLFWGWYGVYLISQISFIKYFKWCLSSRLYICRILMVLSGVRFSIILVFLSIYVIYTWNFVYNMYWYKVQYQYIWLSCMFVCLIKILTMVSLFWISTVILVNF
jgi:hypothetical protein